MVVQAEVGRADILRRAESLVADIRSRSEACEAQRRCPAETIAQFEELGLLSICKPKRYGGYELGWDVLCEVSQTLARACASQAWVQNIFADHAQKIGTFPRAAQEDVWGDTPNARISASFDPVGKARRVDGGVIFSGRHGFSSGIDYAQWVIAGGHIVDDDGQLKRSFFLIPVKDITIIDDWHVVGLAGTGSKSFEAKDVFVPQHRIQYGEDAELGRGPGTEVNSAPVYRWPGGGVPAHFAAVVVGVAEGFLANYIEYTLSRKSRGTPVAELTGTQIGVGIASAQIHAAAMVYLDAARAIMRTLERGEEVPLAQKLQAKRDSCFAAQISLEAVTRLFNAAGGRALFDHNVLQRQYRDLIMAAAHHALVWDSASADYGRYALRAANEA